MNQFRIFVVVVLLCTSIVVAQHPIKFEVNIQKQTYLEGEGVDIGRCLINTSETIQQPTGSINISMHNDSRNTLIPYYGPRGNWFDAKDKKLKPQEESYRIIDLTEFFGERYCLVGNHHILKAGEYTATLSYEEDGVLIKDTLLSFRVDVPAGEELIVLNSFIEVSKHFKGAKIYSEELRALLDAHPQSVYNPIILNDLHTAYYILLSDSLKALECGKELIEKYPWSGKGQFILDYLLKKLPEKTERIEYLNKIIPKASNSPMQKLLERKLKAEMDE
ncbi:MAG: hypothetical protein COW85_05335 [Ignavibacteria bacterium CG22_combo_CG10-13_8_21_14_all_37_15]|nr:hypothetical protein [Ignavibacteria bacterium]PIP78133.1 MAG: hypothetical protein COW85_05335 [Ignavibacteria bacterium CG22_combo_CG10-13_8_21_14_all_37_15]